MKLVSGLLSGHVLQRAPRGASVAVTGETEASGTVIATIAAGKKVLRGWKRKKVGAAKDGRFSALLKGIPTGGPYRIQFEVGREKVAVDDVFVGDLWLMAGQSNMEGVGNLADACPPHPEVRCFNMDHTWTQAREPLHHLPESPDRVHNDGNRQTPEAAAKSKRARLKGTGVGLYFAREMHKRTGVPQGLIATAHGGTSMSQWDPDKRKLQGDSLYWSMLSSLKDVGQPLAGVLWYQGCSDGNHIEAPHYTKRMHALVAAIRADQKQSDLPFVVVQIGRFVTQPGDEKGWNSVQDQQRLLPRTIKRLAVVPTIDLELDDLIHISGKSYAILGQRMASAADRIVHGNKKEKAMPEPALACVLGGYRYGPAVEVRFANVVGGLRSDGLARGFTVVDGDGKPIEQIYKVQLDGDKAILGMSDELQYEHRLMYGWGKNPVCTIRDGRGFPLPVFGPLSVVNPSPISGWFRSWSASELCPGEDIATLPRPTPENSGPLTQRTWDNSGFINQHEAWLGKSGHQIFFADIDLPHQMMLEARLGYDGPIRMWVDEHDAFRDLAGTNPATADKGRFPMTLAAGRHRLTVAMAIAKGGAWGFMLRFRRLDGKPNQDRPLLPLAI